MVGRLHSLSSGWRVRVLERWSLSVNSSHSNESFSSIVLFTSLFVCCFLFSVLKNSHLNALVSLRRVSASASSPRPIWQHATTPCRMKWENHEWSMYPAKTTRISFDIRNPNIVDVCQMWLKRAQKWDNLRRFQQKTKIISRYPRVNRFERPLQIFWVYKENEWIGCTTVHVCQGRVAILGTCAKETNRTRSLSRDNHIIHITMHTPIWCWHTQIHHSTMNKQSHSFYIQVFLVDVEVERPERSGKVLIMFVNGDSQV